MINIDNSILLIIDVQKKLLNAVFNKDSVQKKAEILTKAASILNIPVFITEQYPKGLGYTIPEITDNIDNLNTTFIEKEDFNAFLSPHPRKKFKEARKTEVLVFGIETHICVYQTALELLSRKFDVTIVADACGSRSEQEHNYALNSLRQHHAEIKTTEMVLFELLKTSKHPKFKEIQNLIK